MSLLQSLGGYLVGLVGTHLHDVGILDGTAAEGDEQTDEGDERHHQTGPVTKAAIEHIVDVAVAAPYYDIQTGSAIKIVAPAKSMIKSLSSTDGYVGNGESKEIKVTLAANDELVAGTSDQLSHRYHQRPYQPKLNR